MVEESGCLDGFVNKFICGDAVSVMKLIPDRSIDIVITSPPYNLRNSTGTGMVAGWSGMWPKTALASGYSSHDDNMSYDKYVSWQRDCLAEMLRVIREDGAIFYNHKWRVQAVYWYRYFPGVL